MLLLLATIGGCTPKDDLTDSGVGTAPTVLSNSPEHQAVDQVLNVETPWRGRSSWTARPPPSGRSHT